MTLWDFSVSLYPKPGVADACLTLQNQHGFDVNVLLCCLWLAQRRQSLRAEFLQELLAQSDAWRSELIGPLRGLRGKMKNWPDDTLPAFATQPGFTELRAEIKAAELHGEKLQQLGLEQLICRAGDAKGASEALAKDESLLGFANNWRVLVAHYSASLHSADTESREKKGAFPADPESCEAVAAAAAASQRVLEIAEQCDSNLYRDLHRVLDEAGLLKS